MKASRRRWRPLARLLFVPVVPVEGALSLQIHEHLLSLTKAPGRMPTRPESSAHRRELIVQADPEVLASIMVEQFQGNDQDTSNKIKLSPQESNRANDSNTSPVLAGCR